MPAVESESQGPCKGEGLPGRASGRIGLFDLTILLTAFVFVSNLPEGLSHMGGPPPLVTQVLFVGLAALLVLGRSIKGAPLVEGRALERLRPVIAWIFAWVILLIHGFLVSGMEPAVVEIFIARLKSGLMLLLLLLALVQSRRLDLLPRLLAVAVAVGAALTYYDFLVPTFTSVNGRGAGFYLNANQAAEALTLGMIGAVPFVPKQLRLPFVALAALGVAVTFSRSGWLILTLATVVLIWEGRLGFQRQRRVLGLAVVLGVGFLGLSILNGSLAAIIASTSLAGFFDSNTLGRLGLAEFASDNSASERAAVLRLAIETFWSGDWGILGHGLGYTIIWDFPVSTHNMYLLFLVEHGLVGLGLYLWFIHLLLTRSSGTGRLMGFAVAYLSLFSHNLLDTPWRIVIMAFVFLTPFLDGKEDGSAAAEDRS